MTIILYIFAKLDRRGDQGKRSASTSADANHVLRIFYSFTNQSLATRCIK